MLVALLIGALSGSAAEAAEVRVLSPAQGEALRRDQAEVSLEISGEPLTTYAVHVNGAQDTVVVVTDEAGHGLGGTVVDVLPLMRTRVPVAASEPGLDEGHAEDRLYRVLTLDLWGPQDGVWSPDPLDRARVVLVDLRTWDDDFEPMLDPGEPLIDGLAVGVTSEGLRRLEAPMLAELPAAPMQSFDTVLLDHLGDGVPAGAVTPPPGTCVPLDQVPWTLQAALAPEIAQALAGAAALPVCKRALEMTTVGAWQAAVLAHGYESRPSLGSRANLSLCVEGMDASLVDLWTGGVAIELQGVDGAVLAETWHLGPAGLVDVDLAAWLVYRDGAYEAGPCPLVPAQALPPELAVCPALPFGGDQAAGPPVRLDVAPDPVDHGLLADQQGLSASTLWDPWLDASADGLCGHPVLAGSVAGLVGQVGATAAGLLDAAWDAGTPAPTQLGAGLEALLDSWTLAEGRDAPVAVDARMTELVELRADPDDWEAPQGLAAFYDTAAEPLEPWPLNDAMIFAPEVVPWPDTGALSWWGTPLDARLAVSTGAVNQVLAAAATTDVLAGPVSLEGVDVAALIPELAGQGPLAASLRWPVAPAITMAPTGVVGDDALMLHIAGLELAFHPPGEPESPLLVLVVDALDPAFELALGETDGALEADLVLEQLAVTVGSHTLDRWPSEDGLATRVGPLLVAEIVPGLQDAVALLPVPEFQGLQAGVRLVEPEVPYQGGDVVLFSIRFSDDASRQESAPGHIPR